MPITIFISYSNDDRGKMLSLRKHIEKQSSLKAIVVADDRKASKLLTDKVKEGIKDCDYFVCILTGKSIKNQWVNQEIGYATAIGKPIMPIVESGIVNKLKGFVHKQVDLPYSVKTIGVSMRAQSVLFSKRAKVLVDDILLEHRVVPKEVGIESLFPGIWYRELPETGKVNLRIEVKNGNEYWSDGRFNFHITDFRFDRSNKRILFKKRDPNTGQEAANDLKVVRLAHRYEGTENGKRVRYVRVLPPQSKENS